MNKNEKTIRDDKRPFYKRWVFWAVAVAILVIGIIWAGSDYNTNNNGITNTNSITQTDEGENGDSELNKIKFSISEAKNDVTGNWRIAVISEPIVMSDHAVAYYQKYIKDDKEIHAIVNRNKNTTTSIQKLSGMIYVKTHEYIKDEEQDAKKMFTGKLLAEKYFNPDTGEEIKL